MDFTFLKIAGDEALKQLEQYRSQFPVTGQYPFLIGNDKELRLILENAEFNELDLAGIIQNSLNLKADDWIAQRREEAKADDYPSDDLIGKWPGEIFQKGSITLHKNILTNNTQQEVNLGFRRCRHLGNCLPS